MTHYLDLAHFFGIISKVYQTTKSPQKVLLAAVSLRVFRWSFPLKFFISYTCKHIGCALENWVQWVSNNAKTSELSPWEYRKCWHSKCGSAGWVRSRGATGAKDKEIPWEQRADSTSEPRRSQPPHRWQVQVEEDGGDAGVTLNRRCCQSTIPLFPCRQAQMPPPSCPDCILHTFPQRLEEGLGEGTQTGIRYGGQRNSTSPLSPLLLHLLLCVHRAITTMGILRQTYPSKMKGAFQSHRPQR